MVKTISPGKLDALQADINAMIKGVQETTGVDEGKKLVFLNFLRALADYSLIDTNLNMELQATSLLRRVGAPVHEGYLTMYPHISNRDVLFMSVAPGQKLLSAVAENTDGEKLRGAAESIYSLAFLQWARCGIAHGNLVSDNIFADFGRAAQALLTPIDLGIHVPLNVMTLFRLGKLVHAVSTNNLDAAVGAIGALSVNDRVIKEAQQRKSNVTSDGNPLPHALSKKLLADAKDAIKKVWQGNNPNLGAKVFRSLLAAGRMPDNRGIWIDFDVLMAAVAVYQCNMTAKQVCPDLDEARVMAELPARLCRELPRRLWTLVPGFA